MKPIAPTLAALCLAAAAQAQPAPPLVVRGIVTAATETTLTLKTQTGPLWVALEPGWSVGVAHRVSLNALQPGVLIGTAEIPSSESAGQALEVHILRPYPWDLQPGAMMTVGTVEQAVRGRHGDRELDIALAGDHRHITVPADVAVVEILAAGHDQVRYGQTAVLLARRGRNGGFSADAVTVGADSARPPM